MIPIRQIQGVTTHRAGMRFTVVKVATAADVVELHVNKQQAEQIKATLTRLMPSGTAPAAAQVSQLRLLPQMSWPSLPNLRDAGALTDDEFAAQKAKLLGTSELRSACCPRLTPRTGF